MPSDDTLYLYTSLTAGSSHIITATSRIETILKANKIPFKAVDCATDDRARMLWGRRSKGRKIPGLVKFNEVVADLEQVEEWNEYGELEDELDSIVDIFGDVPISATSAEAQAAAAQRASQSGTSSSSAARTASETRHISISEPTADERKAKDAAKKEKDTPMSAALRQAGAEAAAKAGQKKADAAEVIRAQARKSGDATANTVPAPIVATSDGGGTTVASKLDPVSADPETANTGAKTPELLAAEGATKTTSTERVDKDASDDDATDKSNEEQVLDQRRKSSVPQKTSSLAKVTSIDDAHTVSAPKTPDTKSATSTTTKPKTVLEQEEESDEDEDEDEDDEEDDDNDSSEESEEDEGENDDDEEEEEEMEKEDKAPSKVPSETLSRTPAAKVAATDKQEGKVLKGQVPQKQGAKDADKAGVSVGD